DKTYDRSTAAGINCTSLAGVLTTADAPAGGTATFDTKNAGTNKTVTLTGATLTGTDAADYTLDSVATTTANISLAGLEVAFAAADKTYDATTGATLIGAALVTVLPSGEHVD